jgi:hypothetical protein
VTLLPCKVTNLRLAAGCSSSSVGGMKNDDDRVSRASTYRRMKICKLQTATRDPPPPSRRLLALRREEHVLQRLDGHVLSLRIPNRLQPEGFRPLKSDSTSPLATGIADTQIPTNRSRPRCPR